MPASLMTTVSLFRAHGVSPLILFVALAHTPSIVSVANPEHSWFARPGGKRNCHSSHIGGVWGEQGSIYVP